jgi:hypothetical protein
MPQGPVDLGMAFLKSGYLFQLIKGSEVLGGVLLLGNRFVPPGAGGAGAPSVAREGRGCRRVFAVAGARIR